MPDKSDRIANDAEEAIAASFRLVHHIKRFTPSIRHGVRYIAIDDGKDCYLVEINVEKV